MNVDNINRLADFLESLPDKKFTMNYFHGEWIAEYQDFEGQISTQPIQCNTACCIAGWAVCEYADEALPAYFGDDYKRIEVIEWGALDIEVRGIHKKKHDYEDIAAKFLGLTKAQADELFLPGHLHLSSIPRVMAIAVLRSLAETGKVDWYRHRDLAPGLFEYDEVD